eukprot:30922-Pelagococcus_subviridis.AAC.3
MALSRRARGGAADLGAAEDAAAGVSARDERCDDDVRRARGGRCFSTTPPPPSPGFSPLLSLLSSSLYDHIRTPPPRIPRPRIPRPSKHAHERREREDDEQHPAGDPNLSLRDAFAEGRSIRANVGVEFIGSAPEQRAADDGDGRREEMSDRRARRHPERVLRRPERDRREHAPIAPLRDEHQRERLPVVGEPPRRGVSLGARSSAFARGGF